MIIKFKKKKMVSESTQFKELTELEVLEIIDDLKQNKIKINTLELGNIVLWENQEYENLTKYNRQDIIDRVNQLFK